ncbi:intracellular septation protein A [Alcanivorax hongdengensis A-11-3]|uniref:Inner membrane-spanning protein YciB n=1 Tax=Alcanivorax hongdengensis A-11-3 TaxID=1177179 RepID=L0WAN6_9GAMM|nr:inner membrane-spanning protein YciB [Alcanivorax hongdengensis]EKF74064.1 intracellular septation protein A [Alcanivorax hongdengensis A-11-3]
MKQLFDYLPVVVFFGLYFLGGRDIMLATQGIMAASVVQIVLGWLVWRTVKRMHLMVFVITMIFGTLTLLFRDPVFIKWRPSIISFVLAAVLLVGHFLRERNLLQRLCESLMASGFGFVVALSKKDWQRLNLAFVLYFVFLGLLNLYIAFRFSTDFWMTFKMFGFSAIQMLFYGCVIGYIYKRMPEADRQRLFHGKNDDPTPPPANQEKKDDDAVRDHQ